MTTFTSIFLIVMAGLVYIAYFYTERQLYAEQTRLRIIQERDCIAIRLHYGYFRKLLCSDDKLIYKDEVLDHLVCVLQIYDAYLPHKPIVSHDPHPAGGLGTIFSGGETAPHKTVGK